MMPTNKHKRKNTAHASSKTAKDSKSLGLISAHPKFFVFVGLFLVALAIYLLTFESKDNAMFGLAMLSLLAGVVTTFSANFAMPKNKAR
jgi:hypothetical protein